MTAIVTLTMNPALDIAMATEQVMPTHKLRCATPRYDPGGGGINVARAVHALGGAATAVFPAGGPAGELIAHLLCEEGVAADIVAVAGYTRESLAVEARRSGNQFRFMLPGPVISGSDQERCLNRVAATRADFIVASGSVPLGVADNFYTRAGALAASLEKHFVLDTSGAALRHAGYGVYLLKPNLRELEELVGSAIRGEAEEEQAAREMVAQGRRPVCFPPSRLFQARPTRSAPPTSKASASCDRWGEEVARVTSTQKIKSQCFQRLDESAQNNPFVAIGRIERSTTLVSISIRLSSRKRWRPSQWLTP